MTSINSIQNMKNTGLGILFLLTLTACASQKKVEKDMTNANTESKDKSVLLVGMYHFDSPGLDTYNLKTDDYTSSKRQSEIEEVVELLAAYKPTKIFIEFMPNQQKAIDTLYDQYLKDEIQLNDIKGSINEVYQIGFRLGKKMDGIDVTAIDSWGNWLGPYADFIADTLNVEFYKEAKEKAKQQHVEKQQLFLSNTVRENIIYLNKPQEIIRNHSYYNDVAIKLQDTTNSLLSYQEKEEEIDGAPYLMRSFDFNNIGIELVVEWYKRNLFIYRNILENTEENDRVVVLFGSGHMYYLNQFLQSNSDFEVVSVNDYLIPKK